MPSVPYDSSRVSDAPIPNVRVNTEQPLEAFGGGSSVTGPESGVKHLTSDLMEIQERSYKAANDAAKVTGQNQLDDIYAKGLYGTTGPDGKPIPGLIQKISGAGQGAHAVSDDWFNQYDKHTSQMIAQAPNDVQKSALVNQVQDTRKKAWMAAQIHLLAEQKRYEKDTNDSALDNSVNVGTLSYNIPGMVDSQVEKIKTIQDAYAKTHGQSTEENDNVKNQKIAQLYQGVVQKYFANGQADEGRQFYDSIKDQVVDKKISVDLDNFVQKATLATDSDRLAAQLAGKYSDKQAATEAIDKIGDQDLKDAVRPKVMARIAINEKQTQAFKDNNFLQAADIAQKTGRFGMVPLTVAQTLGPDEEDAIKRLANNASGAKIIKTDPKVFAEYNGMPPGDLARVSQADLGKKVLPYLSTEDQATITQQWRQSREGLGGNQQSLAKQNQLSTNKQILLSEITQARVAGIGQTDTIQNIMGNIVHRNAYNQIEDAVQQRIDSQQQLTGKPLNPKEVKEITHEVVNQKVFTVTPGHFWDSETDKTVAELTPEEAKNYRIHVSNIPVPVQQKIYRAGLMSGGIPVGVPFDKAVSKYRDKFEKAAGAASRGANMNQIRSIMGEK